MNSWYKFILVTFPIYLIFLALTVELFAYALKDTDKLVAALEKGNNQAEVAILGDSITYDVLKTYKIHKNNNVVNLTTNLASGLIGGYFIIKRYLDHNAPIQHLIIASTPEFYSYEPEGKSAEVYLFSIFQKKNEILLLKEALKNFEEPKEKLAILNLEDKIFYKLSSYLFGRNIDFNTGKELPDRDMMPNQPTIETNLSFEESDTARLRISADIKKRSEEIISMSQSAKSSIVKICDLSDRYNFQIHLIRSPMPKTVVKEWEKKGVMKKLNQNIASYCPKIKFFTTESSWNVPDSAMRDSDHLKRPGWTNFYALILTKMVRSLLP